MVRELHVYGTALAVHSRDDQKFQHQGFGGQLMLAAERIARSEPRSHKMAVISGVGTRQYYRKLGYHLEGPYMVKSLGPPPRHRSQAHPGSKNVLATPQEDELPGLDATLVMD